MVANEGRPACMELARRQSPIKSPGTTKGCGVNYSTFQVKNMHFKIQSFTYSFKLGNEHL